MTVEYASAAVAALFQASLNGAITTGLPSSRDAGLAPGTCDAIDLVAANHPEAEARLIADAFDAFASDHGQFDGERLVVEARARPTTRARGTTTRKGRYRIT